MRKNIQLLTFIIHFLLGQSAEQIKQARDIIKNTGLSESEIKNKAKSQGYLDTQFKNIDGKQESFNDDLKKEASQSKDTKDAQDLGQSNKLPNEGEDLNNLEIEEIQPVKNDEDNLEIIDELDIESKTENFGDKIKHFGYDIFSQDPAVFQATSVGVVDPDYLIGPGDEIIVMLWGETQFRQVLSVDREGFVFVSEIGQVFVNGLNLNLLEAKLFRVFSQSYASLNPQGRSPTTFLDVSLGNLRPLRIQVLGEVAQPGAYTVSPSATLFSALYYFNGPTTLGSLRDVQLIRGGKKIASIDFYDFLLTGKKPNDQKLQLDDVIFIPSRLKTVTIEGEVKRSGIYELKPEETLNDLIAIAGGLKITAYLDRSQIDRVVSFQDRERLGMDRMYIDVNIKDIINTEKKFSVQDEDHVKIFSILDLRQNTVDLRGSVTRPGRYDLGESLKLADLISKADGLLGDAYLDRVDIVRVRPDFSEELIKLNLSKALEGDIENNIELRSLDRIRIYGITEMVPSTYVSITGHVKRPGRFLRQENMTLYDLIFKAGGFLDHEFKKLTYLERAELIRVFKNSDKKEIITFNLGQVLDKQGIANINLQADDLVRIYSIREIQGSTRYVSIGGHVKRPGQYELYEGNMRLYDILFKAGGFDDPIFNSKTFSARADLIRFDSDQITKTIIPFNLDSVLKDKSSKENLLLMPGDEIRVYSETVFNTVKTVSIDGEVRKPGNYNLKTKMNLKDLILEAGGLKENVYKYRVEVARLNPMNKSLDEYAEVLTFNIDEKFSMSNLFKDQKLKKEMSPLSEDFLLHPYDKVYIRPDPYFNFQKQVEITGNVLYPGFYVILSPYEKISQIVDRAGGLLPNANLLSSSYFRGQKKINVVFDEILKNPKSKLNFNVQDGDQINIGSYANTVSIFGEVNFPGIHRYVPGKSIKYYIDVAGGLNLNAEKKNIWIVYPNGDSRKYKKKLIFKQKVVDGSVINIGRKEEEPPFDGTEYAKEVTSILANLAQTITIVMLAMNNN